MPFNGRPELGGNSVNHRLQHMLDKQDIVETLMRYTRGIDRADPELLRSVYHPDAVDNHGAFSGTRDEFIDWAMSVVGTFEVSQHSMSNIQIDLQGDKANVETYLRVLHVTKDPRLEEIIYVRLLDLFEKREGEWKILNRLVVIDHSSTRECPEPYSAQEDYVRAGQSKADPVYTHRWP